MGPLIARFRSAWNDVATRWYVQSVVQQQVEFNAAVVRSLDALARSAEAQETLALAAPALLGDKLQALEKRVAALEQEQGTANGGR